MSLTNANYYLISQKICRMTTLSKKVWKTYEELLVVQLRQDNAKKYVIMSWRHWAGKLDDRARAGIMDSCTSMLVLKMEALCHAHHPFAPLFLHGWGKMGVPIQAQFWDIQVEPVLCTEPLLIRRHLTGMTNQHQGWSAGRPPVRD